MHLETAKTWAKSSRKLFSFRFFNSLNETSFSLRSTFVVSTSKTSKVPIRFLCKNVSLSNVLNQNYNECHKFELINGRFRKESTQSEHLLRMGSKTLNDSAQFLDFSGLCPVLERRFELKLLKSLQLESCIEWFRIVSEYIPTQSKPFIRQNENLCKM